MPSLGVEILAMTLAVLGWIFAVVSCCLPMWKVTAFLGMKAFTTEITWEGIWMTCLYQSTGLMQCKLYDSMLALSASLQTARALTIISIVLGALGLLTATVGAKCTTCVDGEAAKARVKTAAGGTFVLAALAQMIPVSWFAHSVIMDFYNPSVPEEQKKEMGAALYLGWAAGALLLTGGNILCFSCPKHPGKRFEPPSVEIYSQNKSSAPSGYKRVDI